jgi:hypothetical protein
MNRWLRQLLGSTHSLIPGMQIGRAGAPTLVGVYGVPRGGTNFIAAQVHYHREVFGVSEHELDWRLPLALYWRKRTVLREHGWQDKRVEQIRRVVFNKVQRGGALWRRDADFPEGSRFIFYFRNPIRCHLSRQAFLEKFPDHPFETEAEGFDAMLEDFRGMIETCRTISRRFPSLVLAHEHFCCRFDEGHETLRSFLEISPDGWITPDAFFVRCGHCRGALEVETGKKGRWFRCTACGQTLLGHGHFNPLREIDLDDIRSEAWKQLPGMEERFARLRRELGDAVADYYENGAFERNLELG